ncbi:hypothetical protein F5Y16DRAFT_382773 [Xylariaceae sp. FL0255]|nr:hypothetical protein F5Y16DRAFT_382773 [Xylariaceae sp. FL0255]
MAFQLHVWGPALGLASIDAECLAAVTCFRQVVLVQDWTLVPCNDTTVSPDKTLPALLHEGTWTSGYTNIISYLKQHLESFANRLGDSDFTPRQNADLLAYASYLTTRGSGLVAVSLYASPNAWTEVTQPAYGSLLPFPLTWTIPMSLHAAAVEKAEHLGMGHLNVEPDSQPEGPPVETTATGFMRLREQLGPQKSLRPEQTTAIRFHSLAGDFLGTLEAALRGNRYFLGAKRPSSLDFLAYGYLSLMTVKTPYSLLSYIMTANDRPLAIFLRTMNNKTRKCPAPNMEEQPGNALRTLGIFADGAMENIFGFGANWKKWRRGAIKSYDEDRVRDPGQLWLAVGGAIAGVAAIGTAALFRASIPFGSPIHRFEPPREEKGLLRFGEAGAFFQELPMFNGPPIARYTA